MDQTILYFLIYLLEGGILWQYCSTLFLPRRSLPVRCLLLLALYSFLAWVFSLHNMPLNGILVLLANLLFIFSVHRIDFLSSLFHATLATSIMGLSELIVLGLMPNIAHHFNQASDYTDRLILLTIYSKLVYFILMFLLSHLLSKHQEKNRVHLRELMMILATPFLSVWIIITLFQVCYEYRLSNSLYRMILVSCLFLLFINVMIWGIYRYLQKKNQAFTRLQLQLQKETFSAEHYSILLKQNEEQQLLIHDIKNHLQSIALLNEQGDSHRIRSYINQLQQSAALKTSAKYCDHKLLNAIIGLYNRRCQENHIDFHTDIRKNTAGFMQEEDITALFCNLLDNAVEAATAYPGGYIELALSSRENTEFVILNLVNSSLTNPFDRDGLLKTSKPDQLHHGYGLKNIEKIVKKYGGEMQMYYQETDHTFHTNILLRR